MSDPDNHEQSAPSAENPYAAELVEGPGGDQQTPSKGSEKVFSDTITGVNTRVSDNVFQAAAIAVCTVLGAVIGAIAFQERIPAALGCGFVGLIVGLFGSGIFLMIFRAVQHLRGKHD